MSEIKLEIYGKGGKVEKTYKTDGYNLMLGTVEDFLSIIDPDKLDDTKAIVDMVRRGMTEVKLFLKDMFPEITDEELKHTSVEGIVRCIVQTATAVGDSLKNLKSGN